MRPPNWLGIDRDLWLTGVICIGNIGLGLLIVFLYKVPKPAAAFMWAFAANKSGVETHTIEEAREIIDFDVLYTRTNWSDPKIQARLQQAERYEILVPKKIPLEMIRNLPNG